MSYDKDALRTGLCMTFLPCVSGDTMGKLWISESSVRNHYGMTTDPLVSMRNPWCGVLDTVRHSNDIKHLAQVGG